MIVYEKNNKLNINFENELDNPDIEIGKGEINVDGNNIASGESGAVFIVHLNNDDTLDKTFKEIKDAKNAGKIVCMEMSFEGATTIFYLIFISTNPINMELRFAYADEVQSYTVKEENDYPAYNP